MDRLIALDIPPVCGAVLPTGPQTQDSQCKQAGVWNAESLHLDHEPPLTAAERQRHEAVCDPNRVQWLCASCHDAKTRRQSGAVDRGDGYRIF